jgi:predicted Rossmann fold flavoprotein
MNDCYQHLFTVKVIIYTLSFRKTIFFSQNRRWPDFRILHSQRSSECDVMVANRLALSTPTIIMVNDERLDYHYIPQSNTTQRSVCKLTVNPIVGCSCRLLLVAALERCKQVHPLAGKCMSERVNFDTKRFPEMPLLLKIFMVALLVQSWHLLPLRRSSRGCCSFYCKHFSTALSTTAAARQNKRIAVVGGGASGIFAAIHAATSNNNSNVQVTVLEAGRETLTKVKISGGGRCNVLHDATMPPWKLLEGYPRGARELRGVFHRHFPVTAAVAWFQEHGVQLKTEGDGRMFPTTDSSQTVIDALLNAAAQAGVDIQRGCRVESIVKPDDEGGLFRIAYTEKRNEQKEQKTLEFDAVVLATGSAPAGYALVKQLQLDFVDTVPSLFTLSTGPDIQEGGVLHELAGISVPNALVSFHVPNNVKGKSKWIEQNGPLMITHHGLSGPAALRLSAFGAREFADSKYHGDLKVCWDVELSTKIEDVFELLWGMRDSNPRKTIASQCPSSVSSVIPKRLWSSLVASAGVASDQTWDHASKKQVRKIAEQIIACPLKLTGKGTFKEEFVTAGGVSLKAIDMKTMQSKRCPGLFLCGELIDIDGVTGGYNFLNCWSTGFLAGTSAAVMVERSYSAEIEQEDASQLRLVAE